LHPPTSPKELKLNSGVSSILQLSSGFTIEVRPLPPYYLDFMDDALPYLDPVKREIVLAAGDIHTINYTVPETPPDVSDAEEYALYVKHIEIAQKNQEILTIRDRSRRDYLLVSCVEVKEGPVDINDNEWLERLLTSMPEIEPPATPQKRKLMFLKAVVIGSQSDYAAIIQASLFQEVNMQGVTSALRGFRSQVVEQKHRRRHGKSGG